MSEFDHGLERCPDCGCPSNGVCDGCKPPICRCPDCGDETGDGNLCHDCEEDRRADACTDYMLPPQSTPASAKEGKSK